MEPVIELKNVSFTAQNNEIIHDVSYKFNPGKTFALVGPSGGGKSTVLKLAAGLLVPTRGEVYFKGRNLFSMNRFQNLEFRQESAVVFQDSALWANQNLYQILELPLKIHFPDMKKKDRDTRIKEVLMEAGYKRDILIRPAMLSMGEQKLIAFARAMLCRPRILFLDEWTESLDDDAAQRLIRIVKRHKEEEATIILISHDFRIIKTLADIVVMISAGKIDMELSGEQMASDVDLARIVEKGMAS